MFGYIKPVHSELLVKEYEFYKSTYCGICRAMKKRTGRLSNVALSYDSVFLALVRMLYVSDAEIGVKRARCIAHPVKKRGMLIENSAISYTARAFAVLTYYKMLDDINDEGAAKRIAFSAARPIFKHGAKMSALSDLSKVAAEKLSEISALEKASESSVDKVADVFGEMLGEFFAHGFSDNDRILLYDLGFHVGRFIYAADAAEDYEGDRREGKYNPYVLLYNGEPLTPENKQSIKCALILECKRMESAVNLMEFGNRYTIENIIKNIIYLGLTKRIEFLDK